MRKCTHCDTEGPYCGRSAGPEFPCCDMCMSCGVTCRSPCKPYCVAEHDRRVKVPPRLVHALKSLAGVSWCGVEIPSTELGTAPRTLHAMTSDAIYTVCKPCLELCVSKPDAPTEAELYGKKLHPPLSADFQIPSAWPEAKVEELLDLNENEMVHDLAKENQRLQDILVKVAGHIVMMNYLYGGYTVGKSREINGISFEILKLTHEHAYDILERTGDWHEVHRRMFEPFDPGHDDTPLDTALADAVRAAVGKLNRPGLSMSQKLRYMRTNKGHGFAEDLFDAVLARLEVEEKDLA